MILSKNLLLSLAVSLLAFQALHAQVESPVVIKEYKTNWDFTTLSPQERISMTVYNKSPKQVEDVIVLVPNDRTIMSSSAEDAYGQKMTITKLTETATVNVDGKEQAFTKYSIKPSQPISPDSELKIARIDFHYKSFYQFKPKKISLFDDQKVHATVYAVPASVYTVEKSVGQVIYGSKDSTKRSEYSTDQVKAPLLSSKRTLAFILNIHFVHSKLTKRYIEISHWGNVYFNDEYYLHNRGAKFRGEYSNIDFNKYNVNTGKNAFREERIRLPTTAWGFFYRDEIGNITTSTVQKTVSKFNFRVAIFT